MKLVCTSAGRNKPEPLRMRAGNYTMELPSGEILQAIYISGERKIFGIIGSDVDIELVGTRLIFRDFSFYTKAPIILEFADKIYHYVITCDYIDYAGYNSSMNANKPQPLELKLVAEIYK